MNLKNLAILGALALLLSLAFRPPSSRGIAESMELDVVRGQIRYDGTSYRARWGEETVRFEGDLRYVGRAHSRDLPVVTHDAVLTTGDFSDPNLVEVSPLENGSGWWRAERRPEGTLVALHFVPGSVAVHDQLAALREGDAVTLEGRLETDGRVDASNGGFWRLNHSNHKLVLVTAVERR